MNRRSALFLVLSVLSLTALGFVMQMSTGGAARGGHEDPQAAVRMQLAAFAVGGGLCVFLASLNYQILRRLALPAFYVSLVLLVLCFIPGIGVTKLGASRWLQLPGFQFQPSEVARISTMILLASWGATWRDKRHSFWHGFAGPLLLLLVPVGLIGAEVDLGTASLLFICGLLMLFIGGMRWIYSVGTVVAGVTALALVITMIPNRTARIRAFLHLEDREFAAAFPDTADLNRQQLQAIMAFGCGGIEGMDLGEGRSKMRYLPLCQSDFIFPVVGEELGLVASLLVVAGFVVFSLSGVMIASAAPDRFGKLLGVGLVSLITFQALINIGVTTACLPNKGMPMPFVSNGGSNLLCNLASVGILLSIFRMGREKERIAFLEHSKLTPRV